MNVDEIFFEEGIATDDHGHDLEQAAYQVSGRFEIRLEGGVVSLGPGDGYAIPRRAPHSVRCVEKGSYILITANRTSDGPEGEVHDHGHDDHGHDAHGHDDHGHDR